MSSKMTTQMPLRKKPMPTHRLHSTGEDPSANPLRPMFVIGFGRVLVILASLVWEVTHLQLGLVELFKNILHTPKFKDCNFYFHKKRREFKLWEKRKKNVERFLTCSVMWKTNEIILYTFSIRFILQVWNLLSPFHFSFPPLFAST